MNKSTDRSENNLQKINKEIIAKKNKIIDMTLIILTLKTFTLYLAK